MRVVVTQPSFPWANGRSRIGLVARLLERWTGELSSTDIVLLPELIGGDASDRAYVGEVQELARQLNTWVVGGSHFRRDGERRFNAGIVATPTGDVAARYEKKHPYGDEHAHAIDAGDGPACFEAAGVRCLVSIYADFWHSAALQGIGRAPDLILVPAFSATQRPTPDMARARWRHATVARAYEFAAFVAVSDWAHPVVFGSGKSAGVAGFAHPNPATPEELHRSLGGASIGAFELDLAAMRDLRANREQRGFDLTRRAPDRSASCP